MLKIVNVPRRLSRDVYDEELSKYINRVHTTPGLLGVMTMGSIGAPGLSDLDLICVVDDQFCRRHAQRLEVSHGGYDRNLFLHGPIVVSKRLVKHLPYILYASNLQDLLGEATSWVSEPEGEVARHLALAYLIDFSESRLVQYGFVHADGVLDMRAWMTRLWSFVHSERLAETANLELSADVRSLIDEIRSMRYQWLAGAEIRESDFIDLFQRSESVAADILRAACEMGFDKLSGPDNDSANKTWIFVKGNKRVVCSPDFKTPRTTAHRVRFFGRSRWLFATDAPTCYARHLMAYGLSPQDGWIRLPEPTSAYEVALQQRAALVREHWQFLIEKGFAGVMGGYLGFPLRNKAGVVSLLDSIFWKINQR